MNKYQNAYSTSRLSKVMMNLWFTLISIVVVGPLLIIISVSLSDEMAVARNGYKLFPEKFSLLAYKYIFAAPLGILNSYKITLIVTVCGSIAGLLICTALAYATCRKDYRYRRVVTFYLFFTMLFGAGLIPSYIWMVNYLHLNNTIFSLILPYMVVPMYVLFMKGYLNSIPHSLYESAKIDGANELVIFSKIVLPLAKPGLATVGLFYALMYWNDYYLALLYIDRSDLVPLQLMLYKILMNVEYLSTNAQSLAGAYVRIDQLPSESARMATCFLAAGPMIFIFPFFQKYFVKGLVVGSVKE